MSYKKSNVTSRTWSTPFNTPFFIRWGEWNIKVPMETLREEYDAWEEIQHGCKQTRPCHSAQLGVLTSSVLFTQRTQSLLVQLPLHLSHQALSTGLKMSSRNSSPAPVTSPVSPTPTMSILRPSVKSSRRLSLKDVWAPRPTRFRRQMGRKV